MTDGKMARGSGSKPKVASAAAQLDEMIETLYARHTADAGAASVARREYEERRG